MSTSASSSVVPTSATATATVTDAPSPSTQTPSLGIFKRPEFLAGIEGFRKHFGQEVRSRTTEGYTFLGLDKPVFGYTSLPQPQQPTQHDKLQSAPTKPMAAGKPLAAAETLLAPNGVPQALELGLKAVGPAPHPRTAGIPARTAAAGTRGAQRESESTLDHLMSFIKPSPPPSASTLQRAVAQNAAVAQKPAFVKTVVMSQVHFRLGVVAPPLPAHLGPILPSIDRLVALQLKLDVLQLQEKQRRRQHSCERSNPASAQRKGSSDEPVERIKKRSGTSDSRGNRISAGSRSPPDLEKGQHQLTDPPRTSLRKRAQPGFEIHIRVPKKARQQVLDVITASTPSKRPASSYLALDEGSGIPAEPKRARKADKTLKNTSTEGSAGAGTMPSFAPRSRSPPASKPPRRLHPNQISPARSGSATGLTSESRVHVADKSKGGETSGPRLSTHPPESGNDGLASAAPSSTGRSRAMVDALPVDIEQLKRHSARLEGYTRSFKHSGDAESGSNGRQELEIGYYLESLTCCMEDLWCRSAFSSPSEMKTRWSTLLKLCNHIRRSYNTRDLSAIRGCAALIAASVHYQLSTLTIEIAQGLRESSDTSSMAGDVAKSLADLGRYEQSSHQLLSAYEVSRQFPQTWKRCLSVHTPSPAYEPRSSSLASKWPSVAYPVGATSNPMDVANFVRQLGSEWLEQCGLTLKAPKS
ncbi:hypothetical protein IWW37_003440 [Coemansia sp. RSA 2050]|nr:hypothetical protein IWW37_003440 [Coemansia sp. RSA 2050]